MQLTLSIDDDGFLFAGDHDLNGESDSGLKQATDSYKNGVSYLGVDRLPEKEAKPEDIDPSAMKFYLYTRYVGIFYIAKLFENYRSKC